jgi:hypothetical protein
MTVYPSVFTVAILAISPLATFASRWSGPYLPFGEGTRRRVALGRRRLDVRLAGH